MWHNPIFQSQNNQFSKFHELLWPDKRGNLMWHNPIFAQLLTTTAEERSDKFSIDICKTPKKLSKR